MQAFAVVLCLFATGSAEVAGRHIVLVAEDAVERAAVVEARVESNLLDGLVGLRQQLRGTGQTVAVDELQEGLSAAALADGVGDVVVSSRTATVCSVASAGPVRASTAQNNKRYLAL